MSTEVTGLIGLIALLALIALRIPLGLSFALVGGIGVIILKGLQPGLTMFGIIPFHWMSNYSLSVLPMFILLGLLVGQTGLAEELFAAAYMWFGRLPGGLAIATLIVTALFSAISGSAVAAAATISTVCYPEMKRHQYDSGLASGVIAAGSTMDIMIPPSIPMVIFAMISDQSVGKLFLAGFGPGILEVLLFSLFIMIMVKRNPSLAPIPVAEKASLWEKVRGTRSVIPVVVIFLLVFGGMYRGVFTPTEAGAAGVIASMIVFLATGRLTWQALTGSLFGSLRLTGTIFFILVGTMFFNTFISLSGLAQEMSQFVIALGVSATVFLGVVLLLYLILGAVMEELSMVLLTVPLFLPIVRALHIDPIYFGILVILAWQIGMIAPPVGMIAFVTKSQLPDVSIQTVYKGCLPFLIALIIVEVIVIFVPDVALFLVRTMVN
jgi:tripartite ATP-independent transporter DctM subunit